MGKRKLTVQVAGFGVALGKDVVYGGLVEIEVYGVPQGWPEGFDWDALGDEVQRAVPEAIRDAFKEYAEGVLQRGNRR